MYIAASRVRSLHGLRFYISEFNGQGHLANDERVFIKKYRLQRSFEPLIKLSTYVCQSSMTGFFNRKVFCFNKKYIKKYSLLQKCFGFFKFKYIICFKIMVINCVALAKSVNIEV